MSKETSTSKLISSCLARGVTVTVRDAERYLAAKQLLRTKPDDPAAQLVVNKFMEPLRTKPTKTADGDFRKFLETKPLTAEQQAEEEAYDRRCVDQFLARTADLIPEVVGKCRQAKVFRWELVDGKQNGFTEGIRGFKSRTGLTNETILAMPLDELAGYA